MLSRRARGLPPVQRGESLLPFAPGVADLNAFPWRSWARFLQQAWGEVSARQLADAEPGGDQTDHRADLRDVLGDARGEPRLAAELKQVMAEPNALWVEKRQEIVVGEIGERDRRCLGKRVAERNRNQQALSRQYEMIDFIR